MLVRAYADSFFNRHTLLPCALVYLIKFKHEMGHWGNVQTQKLFCNSQLSYPFFIRLLVAQCLFNTLYSDVACCRDHFLVYYSDSKCLISVD